jgi:hypothetical protein
LNANAGHPSEHAHIQRQAFVGMMMAANGPALLKVERMRIEQAGEGMSAIDRSKRLAEIDASLLKAAAKRELLVREIEGAEFMPRPVHAELVVFPLADPQRMAAR